jgi:hypothetical protein
MTAVAKVVITNIQTLTVGGDQIKGVKSISYQIQKNKVVAAGDNDPGPTTVAKSKYTRIMGNAVFNSDNAMVAALGKEKGNLVVTGTIGSGVTARTKTIKNVQFFTGTGNWTAGDDTKVGEFTLDWEAEWADTDTLATMITDSDA